MSMNVSDGESGSITKLPANILETFIPGYSLISRFLLEVLGFDVTLVVSVCLLIFGLATSVKYMGRHAYRVFEAYFTSFITIESDDDIYEHIMNWLAEQQISKTSRSLMAKTGTPNAWDQDVDDEENEDADEGEMLSFGHADAKVPPKFLPTYGIHRFWHKGRFFELTRDTKQTLLAGWGGSMFQNEETLRLTCIGRSTDPIKELIAECQARFFDKQSSRTVVRRPATKEMRSRGRNPWMRVATRPSRPMETVVLDTDQKDRVLADINEYLHPATARWYANRGIPYRRGYLFHGPPGTGKTSLSFAIAGIFGLDIYCISLLEPTLTEEDLGLLFNNLPRRCVVLLEDIDSAGLVKRDETEVADKSNAEDSNAQLGAELAKAFKSVQEKGTKGKDGNQGISLSGLLNAIDGVASHEGRVLVMTTNFPEKLDDALIRPGRVDMKVGFTMASHAQIRELFIRMYSSTNSKTSKKMNERTKKEKANRPLLGKDSYPTPPSTPKQVLPMHLELRHIADDFAARLPEDTLSPAEIQGFLLTRKKEPQKALAEVDEWRSKLMAAKAVKSKLGPV